MLGHVDCPPSLHPIAKDFVLGCLRVDEHERFHTGKTDVFGSSITRAHPWFQDLDWDAVEAKSFVPEWRPIETLSGKMDLRCAAAKKIAALASFLMISSATRLTSRMRHLQRSTSQPARRWRARKKIHLLISSAPNASYFGC